MKKCTLKSGQHNLVKREDLHKVCSLKSESKILKSGSNILKSGQGKIIRREDLCTICTLKQGQGNIVRWKDLYKVQIQKSGPDTLKSGSGI